MTATKVLAAVAASWAVGAVACAVTMSDCDRGVTLSVTSDPRRPRRLRVKFLYCGDPNSRAAATVGDDPSAAARKTSNPWNGSPLYGGRAWICTSALASYFLAALNVTAPAAAIPSPVSVKMSTQWTRIAWRY